MTNLFDELNEAKRAADRNAGRVCTACAWLEDNPVGDRSNAVRQALASTIGTRTLAEIFRKHDIPVGRDHIGLHRKEGHQ